MMRYAILTLVLAASSAAADEEVRSIPMPSPVRFAEDPQLRFNSTGPWRLVGLVGGSGPTPWTEWFTVPSMEPSIGVDYYWRIWIPDPMTVELRRHGAELRSRMPEQPEQKGRVVLIEDDGELIGIRFGNKAHL